MMFRGYWTKKKIRALAIRISATRQPRFCSLHEATIFLLVFHINDKEQALRCAERLKALGKRTRFVIFIPKKNHLTDKINISWLQIREDQFDHRLPTKQTCDEFCAIKADILIDLTRTDNCAIHYLFLQHPAPFKIGNKSTFRHLFDLTIPMASNDNLLQYFEHILFYLQTIRSK